LEAEPESYASVIEATVGDPDRYGILARRTFQEFQNRLNWDAFCNSYLALVRERVLGEGALATTNANGQSRFVL
jgi:hypothetical protein